MDTILVRIIERLDKRIARLREARKLLREKHLKDLALDQRLQRLVSMRKRLKSKNTTGSPSN